MGRGPGSVGSDAVGCAAVDDAAWAISALLTLGFLVAAAASSGALAIGWFVLGVGMAGVTWVRFRASRRQP